MSLAVSLAYPRSLLWRHADISELSAKPRVNFEGLNNVRPKLSFQKCSSSSKNMNVIPLFTEV